MAIDLTEDQYIDSLKREVTPLGSTLFSTVTPETWVGYLTDAFWEARLDGLLLGFSADEDGTIINEAGGSDMDRKYVALIVLYAGIRVLRNQILNTKTTFRAKAGPTEFEQGTSATMLAEMLKQLRATKDRILDELDAAGFDATSTIMLDSFSTRVFSGGYYPTPELT